MPMIRVSEETKGELVAAGDGRSMNETVKMLLKEHNKEVYD